MVTRWEGIGRLGEKGERVKKYIMAVIFFQHLKDVILLSSGFYHFCWEVVRQSYCSITSKTFYFCFSAVWLWGIYVYFSLYCRLGVCWTSWIWVDLFHSFGRFSAIYPRAAAFSQKSCILRSLETAVLLSAQPSVTTLKALWSLFPQWQPLARATLIPSSCSISAYAPRGKKRQLLIANSFWNLPLSRVLVHHVASTTIRCSKKWFFVIYLDFSRCQQEDWPATPYYILHESRIYLVVSEYLSDATCPLGGSYRIAQSKAGMTDIHRITQHAKYCNSRVYSGRTKEANVK